FFRTISGLFQDLATAPPLLSAANWGGRGNRASPPDRNRKLSGRMKLMRRRISITLTISSLLLVLGLLRLWLPASPPGGALPALQGEAALNHLKEQGLYGSLHEAVAAARYSLYKESEQSGAWLA